MIFRHFQFTTKGTVAGLTAKVVRNRQGKWNQWLDKIRKIRRARDEGKLSQADKVLFAMRIHVSGVLFRDNNNIWTWCLLVIPPPFLSGTRSNLRPDLWNWRDLFKIAWRISCANICCISFEVLKLEKFHLQSIVSSWSKKDFFVSILLQKGISSHPIPNK